jgi:hypothetical protein
MVISPPTEEGELDINGRQVSAIVEHQCREFEGLSAIKKATEMANIESGRREKNREIARLLLALSKADATIKALESVPVSIPTEEEEELDSGVRQTVIILERQCHKLEDFFGRREDHCFSKMGRSLISHP